MLGSITRDPIFCSKTRILLQVKNIIFVRELYIRKTADLLLQLLVGTFPHFVAIGFLFSIRNPYIYRFTNNFSIQSIIFKARTLLFMLGSITRDPIFCSKTWILLQVKNIIFRSLMITNRLLDVVSQLSWQNQPQNISSARRIEKCCNI
jgi:hypothetical protein